MTVLARLMVGIKEQVAGDAHRSATDVVQVAFGPVCREEVRQNFRRYGVA